MIGEKLKDLRIQNGMSLRYVGERVGRSNVTIAYYESGRNAPDLSTLKRLCILYGTDMMEFLGEIYDQL